MTFLKNLIVNLPEIKSPKEKKLGFNVKLKWTLIVLVAFFILSNIPLVGISAVSLERFEYLAIILGASFGSIMSLGIGPIVTASIILQLLVGSKILKIDTSTEEGKKYFHGLQKLLAIAFTIFEAIIFVLLRGLQAMPGMAWVVILQLIVGGLFVILMDEIIQKYGFGSGVGLFIVGGVSWQLFVRSFAFLGQGGTIQPVGRVWVLITSIIEKNTMNTALAAVSIIATIVIFLIVVYVQTMKVELPLSFGRVRGYGIRWPLAFLYTSNIPVILTAALLANVQLFAQLAKSPIIGTFSASGAATGGIVKWITAVDIPSLIIRNSFALEHLFQAIGFTLFMVAGSIMFAVFWVNTSGMDAKSQAKNILNSGLQVPGFRRDPGVLQSILSRYIMPLTVMGGAAVGLLAAGADLMGALVRGTGILLSVMIIYKLYEDIAREHAYDMNPVMRKFMGG